MTSIRERGKAKAIRIRLDYHRQRTWLETSRYLAFVFGAVVACLYGMWIFQIDMASSDGAFSRAAKLSTGPLSLVHANFENDCQQCHADNLGLPLARDAWQLNPESRLAHQENTCQKCHQVEGHFRESLVDTARDRDCAVCHKEHSGRQNKLTAVANAACAECHRSLQDVCKSSALSDQARSVSEFTSQSHGVTNKTSELQFRSTLVDTGRIRFDHAQHLQSGQVDPGVQGGFRLSMLSVTARENYRQPGQSDDAFVQLSCQSCHQGSAVNTRGRTDSVAIEQGRHMAPIEFDKHCAACHQMTYAGQANDMLPLPHVASRKEFAQLLGAKLASGRSGRITRIPEVSEHSTTLQLDKMKIDEAVNAVFERCQQCHLPEDLTEAKIHDALAGTLSPLIPTHWLQNGYFDHASHARIERCEFCHVIPSGNDHKPGPPNDQHHVFIRGPESCTPCHRDEKTPFPPELATEQQRIDKLGPKPQPMWAAANCVMCHRYHWTRQVTQ